MSRLLRATVGAVFAVSIAASPAASAAKVVKSKWRGEFTHWYDRQTHDWFTYPSSMERSLQIGLTVQRKSSKTIKISGFDVAPYEFQCPYRGTNVLIHPTVASATVSRKGRFHVYQFPLLSSPVMNPPVAVPGWKPHLFLILDGEFTSKRTVRGTLFTAVTGCADFYEEGWSAKLPAPAAPKPAPPPAPTVKPIEPGHGDSETFREGAVCQLYWCGYELPTPTIPPLA